jgi:hypothetical protein
MTKARERNTTTPSASGPFKVALDTSLPQDNTSQLVTSEPFLRPQNQDTVERRMECSHYEECLNLAAALDWDSFTCAGCSGKINESLLWRAGQSTKRDAVAQAICGAATRSALKGTAQK